MVAIPEVLYFAPVPFRDHSDMHAVQYDCAVSTYLYELNIFVHIMNIWWQDAQNNNKKERGEKEEEKEK